MRGGIWQVDPKAVRCQAEPHRRDVRTLMTRLQREGQIVPLEVDLNEAGEVLVNNRYYSYAIALVHAARELGWPTIIVTDEHDET